MTTAAIKVTDLHASLSDPALDSMNFLNEIANRYPDAVSFAPGRPYEEFFDTRLIHEYLERFENYLRQEKGLTDEQVCRILFQYGRTKGVIDDLVAKHLAIDEGIQAAPESIVVTVGCQEAMFLVLRALRADERDVLLTVAPAYVGIVGAARLADLPTVAVPGGPAGVDLPALAEAIRRLKAEGRRPRACYIVADHSNPSGISLSTADRHALLKLAEAEDFLILEDNPYGLFSAGDERPPTLKSIDTGRRVVYLGSFAKTGMPGARVGYLVADQETAGGGLLADELAKIKSMLTVNTSPIAQAVVAGKLLTHGCSLVQANEREIAVYRRNMTALLDALAERFPAGSGISWNRPHGGFFLVLSVPFDADDALLERSAREFGVLWTPMRHFASGPGAARAIRLSCSVLTPERIEDGLDRLAALFATTTEKAESKRIDTDSRHLEQTITGLDSYTSIQKEPPRC
ncbi:PLP-dependent aminotransferase family protein [Catenulispora pinisilvae]|uniref:aminotransferase-like domain-containing protein n=1 Tax=Catenulispora pinisilvae TaxID=2705253 RepID=UPI002B26BC5D|nr:PLP-dependent aminotransferase family protein [Catenulispora pinisilvae]